MNINYEKKPAMTFIGYHTEIAPDEGYRKCPEFWDPEFVNSRMIVLCRFILVAGKTVEPVILR